MTFQAVIRSKWRRRRQIQGFLTGLFDEGQPRRKNDGYLAEKRAGCRHVRTTQGFRCPDTLGGGAMAHLHPARSMQDRTAQPKVTDAKSLASPRQIGRVASPRRGVRLVFDQGQRYLRFGSAWLRSRLPSQDRRDRSAARAQEEGGRLSDRRPRKPRGRRLSFYPQSFLRFSCSASLQSP